MREMICGTGGVAIVAGGVWICDNMQSLTKSRPGERFELDRDRVFIDSTNGGTHKIDEGRRTERLLLSANVPVFGYGGRVD